MRPRRQDGPHRPHLHCAGCAPLWLICCFVAAAAAAAAASLVTLMVLHGLLLSHAQCCAQPSISAPSVALVPLLRLSSCCACCARCADAIRAMGALRVENNQLRQLNKFLEVCCCSRPALPAALHWGAGVAANEPATQPQRREQCEPVIDSFNIILHPRRSGCATWRRPVPRACTSST